MKSIVVSASKKYEVLIDKDILRHSGKLIKKVSKAQKAVIVTDDVVNVLYADCVRASLEQSGFDVHVFVFKNGEKQKSHSTLIELYEFLCKKQVTRNDLLIALGGGVVGDLTGFCAATYLRGLDFVQIPTTLLAQIDSSVGGKTGVNIESGKNLVGAFCQPLLVICDTNTLSTLSDEIFSDGVAEAIKYGAIKSKSLFDKLLHEDINEHLVDIIYECIDIKRTLVEKDEFDTGERMLLNFGHTLGHGIEKFYHYEKYTHGSAVSIGMCRLTERSEQYGMTETGTQKLLEKCAEKYNLPTHDGIADEELIQCCVNDKKRSKGTLHIIVIKEIGNSEILPLSINEFFDFVRGEYAHDR
ncbi:MAG: aroB [Oscillospiraceae bacterium]|jgi:3-dehydroquinate synthase|nr:aroB [Oscillospiraceae bacterium]